MYEKFLQKVPLFAQLPWEDLTHLCQLVTEVSLPAGAELFAEGSVANRAYIIYDGELEIIKTIDGREVTVDVQDNPGTVIGEMALLEEGIRLATVRTRRKSFLLMLDHGEVRELMDKSPSATRIMLQTLARRSRALEGHVRHIERMAQLGTLTAGMAHELNNPVAAVSRGAGRLQDQLTALVKVQVDLDHLNLNTEQEARVSVLDRQVLGAIVAPEALEPLIRSDRESELEDWLHKWGVLEPWEISPMLVDMGLDTSDMIELARVFSPAQIPVLMRWLALNFTTRSLIHGVVEGAGRIASIVQALKSYVYLDQAPVQNVNIHDGLDDTLFILRHKLTPQIIIRKEYSTSLPRITAFGSELNQVWTNILDNAIDALSGQGEIVIRTRQEDTMVVVEIEDNGPGIPQTYVSRIFDPFFTTKPPGRGSGLGLNISFLIVQQHQGTINVRSEPGHTIFQVQLPLEFEAE